MANEFAIFLYKNILQESNFQDLFDELLVEYTSKLINNSFDEYNQKYNKLLRYADILSLSENEEHQNLSQQIVIILSQLFPNEKIVKIFKENIYKNVSNFASIELVNQNELSSNSNNDFLSDLVYNAHKIQNIIPDSDKSFFDTQLSVFRAIENNQYYSFSAPTSMGKTFVITRFILNKLQNNSQENFVIIVPTRALITEIAIKMIKEFKKYIGLGKHRVVTSLTSITSNEKVIAILTPERLYYSILENQEIKFQYLFIDEAHKISSTDKRSIIYYKILDILKKDNKLRICFSSPVIPNPNIYLNLTNLRDRNSASNSFKFSPVAQNKIYIDLINKKISIYNPVINKFQENKSIKLDFKNRMDALLRLGKEQSNLIYVSSVSEAINKAIELKKIFEKNKEFIISKNIQEELENVAKEIENTIHEDYYLALLVRSGIAYHIGSLPSGIRVKIENLLRLGFIKYCFCTSTLLEGVNVPVNNLFVFNNKKGRSKLAPVDAYNLLGRAGRVSLNEFGNVFIILDNESSQKYFNRILLDAPPSQTLLPNKAITARTKRYIVESLLSGKTNILEKGEKYEDKHLTEATYNYACKCLNMLLHDICTNNKSYIVNDFVNAKVLSSQDIIEIKNIFKEYIQDDDINISVEQKHSLISAIKRNQIHYPSDFTYEKCLEFLNQLSDIFQWSIYEKETLGNRNRLRYYSVLLLQWMQGNGLHEIIRQALSYNLERKCSIRDSQHKKMVEFNNSIEHKNVVINETMKTIDNIIRYKLSMYFLRFSETYIKIRNHPLKNDWYEFVEYGTSNKLVITLQKYGFTREESIILNKSNYASFLTVGSESIQIKNSLIKNVPSDLAETLNAVKINYPEIFYD